MDVVATRLQQDFRRDFVCVAISAQEMNKWADSFRVAAVCLEDLQCIWLSPLGWCSQTRNWIVSSPPSLCGFQFQLSKHNCIAYIPSLRRHLGNPTASTSPKAPPVDLGEYK